VAGRTLAAYAAVGTAGRQHTGLGRGCLGRSSVCSRSGTGKGEARANAVKGVINFERCAGERRVYDCNLMIEQRSST